MYSRCSYGDKSSREEKGESFYIPMGGMTGMIVGGLVAGPLGMSVGGIGATLVATGYAMWKRGWFN